MRRFHACAATQLVTLAALLLAAPATAQHGQVLAAPPEGAAVYQFNLSDWQEPMCAGAQEWNLEVPRHHWVAMPVGWYAVDEATARANWQHMRYELAVGGHVLPSPPDPSWQVDEVNIACPEHAIIGVGVSPVLYLPPVDEEVTYHVSYLFDETVNDGWYTFEKDSRLVIALTLRPAP